MKKSILNVGKTLNKVEQKEILGGIIEIDTFDPACDQNHDGNWVPGCPCTPGFTYTVYVSKGGYIKGQTITC